MRQLRIDAATAQSPGPVFQADLLPLAGHQRPRRRLAAKPSVCGEYWDQDSQLLHLRARWYDPQIGRFIRADPTENKAR